MQPSFNAHQLALLAIFGNICAQAIEAGHAVEFGILHGVAVFVLVGLAFLVAGGSVGDDINRGDRASTLG